MILGLVVAVKRGREIAKLELMSLGELRNVK